METRGKSANSVIGKAAILFFAATTCAAAYFGFERHDRVQRLENDLTEMNVKLGYNALEAQKAEEAFAAIERNLSAIRQSEGYVLMNLKDESLHEGSVSESRIQAEIQTIEALIADNRILISQLKDEIGARDSRLTEYRQSISSLQERITGYKAKTQELTAQAETLRKDLVSTQYENQLITKELAHKEMVVNRQNQQLNAKDKALRTAYYAVGSFKELKEENVVRKEGGFLGIAAAKAVHHDLNRDRFTKLDILEQTTIPVFSPKAEIVSAHDPSSYELVEGKNEVRWIKINDPALFWENTKYLVVVTKGDQFRETTALR